jgi:hypothetical protein
MVGMSKRLRKLSGGTMYCFSPPVMLATFAVEICLVAYTVWRYKLNRVSRLAMAMFSFLAVFQLAEYMVCGGLGMTANTWARVGFAAITMLPPLGVSLVYALAGKTNKPVVVATYAAAAGFMGYFLLASDVFTGSQCLGNYVIFQLGTTATQLYTIYYYGLLLFTIGLSFQFAGAADAKRKRALQTFSAGYILFMLPTTIVNTIDPTTMSGIPSIMCGFAVLLALVIAFWVMPLVGELREAQSADSKNHRTV